MKIHELLDKPEKWTKDANARDKEGYTIGATNPKAVCWCLYGSMFKCYEEEQRQIADRVRAEFRPGSFVEWNDAPERTFEEVRALCLKLDI